MQNQIFGMLNFERKILFSIINYNQKRSIGCLLYEMCTFQRPFIGDTIYEVFSAIIKEEPPSIINVYSQELNTILKRYLFSATNK